MRAANLFKTMIKKVIRPLIYRFPPIFISPAGLFVWFDTIVATKSVEGDVVEIGCYLGATAAMSARMLKESGSERPYIVIDTFGGFVEEQFESELKLGGASSLKQEFSSNAPDLARWVMDKHGGRDVRMIQGDIAKLPDDAIPRRISACLIDIDLAEPIYQALSRIYPRLSLGGIVVVDDCDDETLYKARIGYERFVKEAGLPSEIRFGKGVVRKL